MLSILNGHTCCHKVACPVDCCKRTRKVCSALNDRGEPAHVRLGGIWEEGFDLAAELPCLIVPVLEADQLSCGACAAKRSCCSAKPAWGHGVASYLTRQGLSRGQFSISSSTTRSWTHLDRAGYWGTSKPACPPPVRCNPSANRHSVWVVAGILTLAAQSCHPPGPGRPAASPLHQASPLQEGHSCSDEQAWSPCQAGWPLTSSNMESTTAWLLYGCRGSAEVDKQG